MLTYECQKTRVAIFQFFSTIQNHISFVIIRWKENHSINKTLLLNLTQTHFNCFQICLLWFHTYKSVACCTRKPFSSEKITFKTFFQVTASIYFTLVNQISKTLNHFKQKWKVFHHHFTTGLCPKKFTCNFSSLPFRS